MENHHTNTFYSNFAKLLRICEDLDIYKLPKNYNLFTPKSLQRYDSMINHNDLLSLCTYRNIEWILYKFDRYTQL